MYGFDFGGLDGIAGVEGISTPAMGAAAEGAGAASSGFNWAGLGERLGNVSSALQGGPADAVTARRKSQELDQQKADNQMKLGLLEESGRNDRQAQQLKQELMAHNERIKLEQDKLAEEQYQHQLQMEQVAQANALKQKELDMEAPVKKSQAAYYDAHGQQVAASAAEQAANTAALDKPYNEWTPRFPQAPFVSQGNNMMTTAREMINKKKGEFAPDRQRPVDPEKVAIAELIKSLGGGLGGKTTTATPAPTKGGW